MRKVKNAAAKKNARTARRHTADFLDACVARVENLEPRLLMTGMAGTAYVVNSAADTVAADGYLTLREAIQAANTNSAVNEAPAGQAVNIDSITFDPSLFNTGAASIVLSGTRLDIIESLVITGPDHDLLYIDGNGSSRVFNIGGGATVVSMYGMTVTGGSDMDMGGGIYISDATLVMTDCEVSGNSAWGTSGTGGGLYVTYGVVNLNNSTISENSSGFFGGGLYANYSVVNATGSTISDNSAYFYGGGIYASNSTTTLADSAISSNASDWDGGGMHIDGGVTILNKSTVAENSAGGCGGGICVRMSGEAYLINSLVNANRASQDGGGLYFYDGSEVTLINSTVSGNGAGSYPGGLYVAPSSTATLYNTIVAFNAATVADENISGIYSGLNNFIGGDPGFVRNPSAGYDEILGTADDDFGDLHLAAGSACIDAGETSYAVDYTSNPLLTDLDGGPRIYGAAVDIGAYEGEHSAAAETDAIYGKLVDSVSGAGLGDVWVYLYQSRDTDHAGSDAWDYVADALTDADGNYNFTGLDPRTYALRIDEQEIGGKHYIDSYLYDITVGEGATVSDLELQARQAGVLYGYVYNSLGQPIPNAEVLVEAAYTLDGEDWHTAYTDASGRYEVYLAPTAQKFYPVKILEAPVDGSPDQYYAVQIAPGLYAASISGTHGPDFHLSLGGTIHGRVIDALGNPVSYEYDIMEPEAYIANGIFEDPNVDTDSNGEFWLHGVPANTDVYFSLDSSTYVYASEQAFAWGERLIGPFRVTPGETLDIPTQIMPRAGSVYGTIRDSEGNGIPGVEVEIRGVDLTGADVWLDDGGEVYTDSYGNYRFDIVPAGTLNLRVSLDGWVPAVSSLFNVSGGEDVSQDMVLQSTDEGVVVSGTVTNFANIAPHNSDGVVLPSRLADAYDEFYYGDGIGIIAYPESMQWKLADWMTPGARLPVDDDVADGYADYFATSEIPGGSFAATLPTGRQVLMGRNSLPGGNGVLFSDPLIIDVAAGSTITDLKINFPTGSGRVYGTVTFPGGYSLPGLDSAWVWVREEGSSALARAVSQTRPDGTYDITGLPDGNYNLLFVAQGLKPVTALMTINGGNAVVRNVTMTVAVTDYSLTNDWSDTQNPNGTWSYNRGSTPMTFQQLNWGGTYTDSPFWTTTPSGTCPPAWSKIVTAPAYWHDWLSGDVVVHSTNNTNDPDLLANVTWTSPGDGVISIDGLAWDAYFGGTRDASWNLYVDGVLYASRSSIVGAYRTDSNAPFDQNLQSGKSLENILVDAGDVVKFEVVSLYTQGWYTGVELNVHFSDMGLPAPQVLSMDSQADGTVTIDFDKTMQTRNVRDQWNVLVVDMADPTRLIPGEVVWSNSNTRLTWYPDLAPGESATWRITLAATTAGGIADIYGVLLDGDGDTLPGGNFIATWAVSPSAPEPLDVLGFTEAPDGTITVDFSNRVLTSLVDPEWDIIVTDSAGNRVSGTLTWSNGDRRLTWRPDFPPAVDEEWTISVGSNYPREFVDVALNGLDGDGGSEGGVTRKWSVTAGAAPSGPILPDRFENNDSPLTPTALDVSAGPLSFRGLTIDTAGDVDWFNFTTGTLGTASDRVFIDADVHGRSLTLELYDAVGNFVQSGVIDSGSAPIGAVRTSISLAGRPAGTYTIRVAGDINPMYDLTIQPPLTGAQETWTVLYYVAGDNNLDEGYYNELDHMEQLDLPSNVSVAVQFDRIAGIAPVWTGTITDDWGDTRRGFLAHDNTPYQMGSWLSAASSLGELDTSSAATLTNFLTWATATQPADHYVLNIVNHGDGVAGVCQDVTSGTNMISPQNVAAAMAATGVHFDVLIMDTCLMGMAELATAVAAQADYMVATEEATYTGAMPTQLGFMEASDTIPWTGRTLAGAVAEATAGLHPQQNKAFGHDFYTTESVLDLSQVAALNAAIRNFVQTADAAAPQGAPGSAAQWNRITAAVVAATQFLNANNRDLGRFMRAVKDDASIAPTIRSAAAGVLAAMEPVVVENYSNGNNSDGLAVTLTASLSWNYGAYAGAFIAASAWDQFLNDLLISQLGKNYASDWAETNNWENQAYRLRQPQGTVTLPTLTIDSPGDKDFFLINLADIGGATSAITVRAVDAFGNTDTTWSPTLEVYEANGPRSPIFGIETTELTTAASLTGEAAGLYYVRIASDGVSAGRYQMTITAPVDPDGGDWVGDNHSEDTPYPLSLVPGNITPWIGLAASGTGSWFAMDLGNLNNGPDGFIQTDSLAGIGLNVLVYDEDGNPLMNATGAQERYNIPRNTSGRIYIRVVGTDDSLYTLTVKAPSYEVYTAPVLLREWSFGSAHVAVYGDSITTVVNPADIAVVFGKNNDVKSITLGKATTTANLGIAVWGASFVGSIKDTRKVGDVSFIASAAPVGTITLSHSLRGTDIDGLVLGGLSLPADVDGDGDAADKTALYLPNGFAKGTALTITGGLGGDIVAANIKAVTVKGQTSNADIVLGGAGVPTIKLSTVNSTNVRSSVGIKSIYAVNWLDLHGGAYISAPSLGSLTIAGAKNAAGNFAASLSITGGAAAALGSVKVAGNIVARTWNITGGVGPVTVGGQVSDFSLLATGSIGAVTLGASSSSDFLAGIAADCTRHAEAHDDFNPFCSIKSFTIKGVKGTPTGTRFFTDSNISAATVGAVNIINGDFANPSDNSEIWASNLVGTPIKSVKNTDKIDKTKTWTWPPKPRSVFAGPLDLIHVV